MTDPLIVFSELFPTRKIPTISVSFSKKFKPWNATIRYNPLLNYFKIHLSHSWKDADEQLQIGLYQSLLTKILKQKVETIEMKLYASFLKNLGKYAQIHTQDEILSPMFDDLNSEYFEGLLEKPNLIWGNKTFRKLGHYAYTTDTIMISQTLAPRMDLVRYVLYHEMLHKKHKFYTKNGKNFHHHTAFKHDEAKYNGAQELEAELTRFVRSQKRKSFWNW